MAWEWASAGRFFLNHEDTKVHEGKKEEGTLFVGPLRGSRFATPCGAKQLVPFRSKLLRAQSVLLRRLRRLAKRGLGECDYGYGGGKDTKILEAPRAGAGGLGLGNLVWATLRGQPCALFFAVFQLISPLPLHELARIVRKSGIFSGVKIAKSL